MPSAFNAASRSGLFPEIGLPVEMLGLSRGEPAGDMADLTAAPRLAGTGEAARTLRGEDQRPAL